MTVTWWAAAGDRLVAPVPAGRLAAVRVLVVLYGLVWLAVRTAHWRNLARLSAERWQPVAFAEWIGPLGVGAVTAIVAVGAVAGIAALAGRAWRLSAPTFAVAMLVLTVHGASWGAILHTEQLLVLHLLVLACGPSGSDAQRRSPQRSAGQQCDAQPRDGSAHAVSRSVPRFRMSAWLCPGVSVETVGSATVGWPLRVMTAVTAAVYFVSGAAKLRFGGGLSWLDGERLMRLVAHDNVRKRLLGDHYSPIARSVVDQRWLFAVAAVVTLVIELGAPLFLLVRRLRVPWVAAAWMFHLGVLALMAILFPYQLSLVAYASVLPAERLVGLVREFVRSRARSLGSAGNGQ